MDGYIYVLSNPAMPGILKIGRSGEGGRRRAAQLYQTGVPEPFHVEFEIASEDCVADEIEVQDRLREKRISSQREFFRCEVIDCVPVIMDVVARAYDHETVFADFAYDLPYLENISAKTGIPVMEIVAAIGTITTREAIGMVERWKTKTLSKRSFMRESWNIKETV